MVRPWLSGLAAVMLFAAPATSQSAATTIFVVRHAEKGPEQPDPSLTPAGAARAASLAFILRDARVSAVFASQFKRTRATAAPLAAAAKLAVQVIDAGQTDSLIAAIRALPGGSRALVVSHSNVVPAIVEKLSGEKVGELSDADYDRLYVVTVRPDGTASAVLMHYGTPSPSGAAPVHE